MIVSISEAKKNATDIKDILHSFSEKQGISLTFHNYTLYQGSVAYSGEFDSVIKDLAKKACENKKKQ